MFNPVEGAINPDLKVIGCVTTTSFAGRGPQTYDVTQVVDDPQMGRCYVTNKVYKTRGNYVEYVVIIDMITAHYEAF